VSRADPLPWGTAYFNDDLPQVWDLNHVRVEGHVPGLEPETVAADTERVQAAAGLDHRRIVFEDERQGAALSSALGRSGWLPQRFVLMRHRHADLLVPASELPRELSAEEHATARAGYARGEPWARDEETVQEVLAADRLQAVPGNARRFGAVVEGVVASFCTLYSDGRTAQVEDVATLERHRGRGLAKGVVSLAVREALAGGHDLVFLVADADDWPKELYRAVGFEEIGFFHQAQQLPPGVTL
jgi:ribosomal protein S18 acetylase RimI-like enzyme